jgi:hypothetical protein
LLLLVQIESATFLCDALTPSDNTTSEVTLDVFMVSDKTTSLGVTLLCDVLTTGSDKTTSEVTLDVVDMSDIIESLEETDSIEVLRLTDSLPKLK